MVNGDEWWLLMAVFDEHFLDPSPSPWIFRVKCWGIGAEERNCP
jgi:hypothetical protein